MRQNHLETLAYGERRAKQARQLRGWRWRCDALQCCAVRTRPGGLSARGQLRLRHALALRLAIGLGLLLALLSWLVVREVQAEVNPEPRELACPSGQTTWLRGTTDPGAAVLARFDGRSIGGGSAAIDGTWTIPVRIEERAGIYPVVVVSRDDGAVVASFTCYVDLPVGATPTGTPTARPSSPVPSPLVATARLTETPVSDETSATLESSLPTEPVTPTSERAEPAPTDPGKSPVPAVTPEAEAPAVAILAIQPQHPQEAELFEYVLLQNTRVEPETLAGWSLVHHGSGQTYAIPTVTLPAGGYLLVWSGEGVDDLDAGSVYWPTPAGRWAPGDEAELRDAAGQVVSVLHVTLPEEHS